MNKALKPLGTVGTFEALLLDRDHTRAEFHVDVHWCGKHTFPGTQDEAIFSGAGQCLDRSNVPRPGSFGFYQPQLTFPNLLKILSKRTKYILFQAQNTAHSVPVHILRFDTLEDGNTLTCPVMFGRSSALFDEFPPSIVISID